MLNATFLGVLTSIGYVILAILSLMLMVIIHELGHYLAGKALGFKILEFSIGFGPPIFKRTNKKTGEKFTIRPFPLGGACMFEGEDEDNPSDTAFNNQKPWKRLIVLFSGALSNFLSAILFIALLFTFYGQLMPTVASLSEESYIAQNNILEVGDIIYAVNGRQVNIVMQDDLQKAFARIGEEGGTFTVLREGKKVKVEVKRSVIFVRDENGDIVYDTDNNPQTKQAFGFVSSLDYVKLNFFVAFGRAFSFSFYVVFKILWLLGQLIGGKLLFSESAGGPIAIISTMTQASRTGFASLAYVVCIISANLAVMNLLPLPALDGSRMVFTVIEWIAKKPVNRKVEGAIHFIGLILLFGLAIFADVLRLLQ